MRLVGKPHVEGDVADATVGVAGIAQCKQGSAQPAPADVGFNAARHLELPEQLAAGNAELAREPGGGQVAMMQVVFDVAAQAATKITCAAARLAAICGTKAGRQKIRDDRPERREFVGTEAECRVGQGLDDA